MIALRIRIARLLLRGTGYHLRAGRKTKSTASDDPSKRVPYTAEDMKAMLAQPFEPKWHDGSSNIANIETVELVRDANAINIALKSNRGR